jgi:hypothetical protein
MLNINKDPRVLQKYVWVALYHNNKIENSSVDGHYRLPISKKINQKLLSYCDNVFSIDPK